MSHVTLRPDMKTSGGEVYDITLDGRYVGTMVLVIREGHRVAGSVQLDEQSLSGLERKEVKTFIQNYVEQMVAAVQAEDCEVVVTCSSFDHIIASENQIGIVKEFVGLEDEDLVSEDEDGLEFIYEEDVEYEEDEEELEDRSEMLRDPSFYELVIVGESRNQVEYHIYDRDEEWIAEVFIRTRGTDISGEINWIYEPLENEIEQVVELIIDDFDEDEVDTIRLDMLFDGELLETLELTHQDLLEDEESDVDEADWDEDEEDEEDKLEAGFSFVQPPEEEVWGSTSQVHSGGYSVILSRDDGDALTYDIYERTHGELPVGCATVDISERGLTGFIEFRDHDSSEDREEIGALLMQELDKERDYDSVHFTMLLNNRPIDEILYETEQLH